MTFTVVDGHDIISSIFTGSSITRRNCCCLPKEFHWQLSCKVGLLNFNGYYNSLLTFMDMAASEEFISQKARRIIVSAPTARELVRKLECISLLLWLDERYENVYTRHPGFQKGSKPLLALDNPFPMELPENLVGERWAFVQLPYSAVVMEISSPEKRPYFGGSLDLDLLGLEIEDAILVPGVAVASSRAKPLAAWMNGLEVDSMEVDTGRACLILSAGVATRYNYATYKKTPVTTREAESWEAAKKACGGLHFLAIQEDLDSNDCVGFWLLLDLPPPPV